jgi:hypothetical protein
MFRPFPGGRQVFLGQIVLNEDVHRGSVGFGLR